MSPLIAVTGASGTVGRALVGLLLDQGVRVRAIARHPDRLQGLAARGAEVVTGDLHDPKFVAPAFRGSDGVFAMIPPNYGHPDPARDRREIAEALAAGMQVARVRHAVTLSSIGADQPAGTGPIAGLRAFEDRIDRTPGVSVVHLRAGYFFQNLLFGIELIRSAGIHGGLVAPEVAIAMVDAGDVSAAAAGLLAGPTFTGRTVRELRTARPWTLRDATAVLGAAIGRPELAYVQLPESETRQALHRMGFSPAMADAYVEMMQAFNRGLIEPRQPLTAETTAPATLENFARRVFAPAFAG